MPNNRHVYLRNKVENEDKFKKTRNVQGTESDNDPEVEASKFPNSSQQDRLRRANAIFYSERKLRNEQRSIEVPAIVDIVVVKFYKVFGDDLKKQFYRKYGLLVSYYEDFNKTVAFEITTAQLFEIFLSHLEMFYESNPNDTYQGKVYNLIALINDFRFLSAKRRIKTFVAGTSSISLITQQTKNDNLLYEFLLSYLRQKEKIISQTDFTSEVINVNILSREEVDEIVSNFDIVKTVTSTRTERRRPGAYGEERRDYGFTVTVPDNIPIVGIIDTGLYRIAPLSACITNIAIDITNIAPYIDDSGHGTAVASLVILGQEFIKEVKTDYVAKAKIAVIKVLEQDNGNLDIVRLTEAIREANESFGIRLFNLSLNDPLPKGYNKSFSDYAYLLDKLAYENDLLIFISVGNISEQRLRELIYDEPHVSHEYPAVFYSPGNGSDIHICETTNISEPSESLNNVSVGALAGNLEQRLSSDITPAEEYPAYYSRKFHYDYEQLVNGSEFIRSQKNKHLNKPDLVFEGGDLFRHESGLEILRSPIEPDGNRYFSKSCGTSLATPLVTSMAAEILTEYPVLRTQTVKALLLNSATLPAGSNTNPPPAFRGFAVNLFRKLIGYGRPDHQVLTSTDDNSATFVIESEIAIEEFQTIFITLPTYINASGNKLNFKATLCYSFLPIKENHLNYLPLQITFGLFKPVEAKDMANMNSEDYKIKAGMSWSDDFFGVDNRLFSNVQQINENVTGVHMEQLGNQISLAIKCTGKKEIPESHRTYLETTNHRFSLILTVTELPSSRANNRLYNDIIAVNTIEIIASAEGEATIDLES